MTQRRARVLRAPMTRPGKNPATKERPSKEDLVSTGTDFGQSEVCDAEVGVVGVVGEGVVEGLDGDGVGEVSLAHMLP